MRRWRRWFKASPTEAPWRLVLGCTEIPLGVQAGPRPEVPIVDTIDALARAAITWARR